MHCRWTLSRGDTKAALIRAALELIEAEGVEALTLRSLAARAGVSRQAPYIYFADKRALLAAVATEGMRRERAWTKRALARRDHPEDRLRAILMTHVRLFREHPRLYHVVYGRIISKSATPELQQEAIESFAEFRGTVEACFPRCPSIEVARMRAIILWGTVRGIAELEAQRQVPASIPGRIETWVNEALEALLAGWRALDDEPPKRRARRSSARR